MHLQCFPPTLRECALFRKRVLLDHVLAEYCLGYSVWFLDIFFCLVCPAFIEKKLKISSTGTMLTADIKSKGFAKE